jgi:hypothetical protein
MIWLEVRYQPQTVSSPDGVLYRVNIEVLTAGGIDKNVFVYRVADDTFMHPATPYDLLNFPVGRAAAVAAGAEFYRMSTVVRTFPTSRSVAETITVHKSRLRLLVKQ